MFPLGSVLFPCMPLPLRIFEERYLVMLARILENEPAEFGVVLIERGQEVGGGEQRFRYGTVAQITELEGAEGFVSVLAQGERRIEIVEWLDDDPFPRAEVRVLPELEWDASLEPLRLRAEQQVRRTLARVSEFADQRWAATVELSDDPVESSWQLAGIAPLGELDQIALLRSASLDALLSGIIELTIAAEETLGAFGDEDDEDPGIDDPEYQAGDEDDDE
ncbi:peptidase S16 [Galbitalea soli]|uniref:Peptidase S16 n=2 Tax=Galbitalea soli TaxID=1268042 RepID=A0A7C9PMA6_9MICO|nr:peptidase S16 [Galbitalea soli]